MTSIEADFAPTASWEMLRLRASLLRKLRRFFEERDFLEVETPLLSHDTVADLHLDPVPVVLPRDARTPSAGIPMWLQTSPEFAMKRLLASGGQRIYQVTKAFRAGESGARHNPEFTIVEWYRVGDTMQDGIQLLAELAQLLFTASRVETISYEAAFRQYAGINPHTAAVEQLARRAAQLKLAAPPQVQSKDEWLNLLLAECVEPRLGTEHPTILFDYPATQAALAQLRTIETVTETGLVQCEVAERFELYFRGVELANGYHELLDPNVLRERIREANETRQRDGRYVVPAESRLLAAMEHGLPPCSGVALGFDRVVMVAGGKSELRDVMAFPLERA